ncbi:hypothetical protein FACS189476_06710 [Spirochaetia bacterium]|nr:hypothetical protein FACS189476_06710 [Spirochaetia bacterium]
MKNKWLFGGITAIMLVFGMMELKADDFGRFNADIPVFGFVELKGYSKAPTARDLTRDTNFINNGDIRVIVRERDFHHDELELELDLYDGPSRIARLDIKIETDRFGDRNYVTHFKYWSTRSGEIQSEYRGTRASLERNFNQFFQVLEQFYNMGTLRG